MRKHYIDNLRWLTVLFLFPYHTFMIYNSFGESFYIKGSNITRVSAFIVATWPWIMPLLFTVAGMSTAYALKKRSLKIYLKERVTKLFVPLIFGILLIMPLMTYYAEQFHNSYTDGYLQQYILFFTKPTDLSGYHGGFSPGHFWFILYLFLISLLALPLISMYEREKKNWLPRTINLPVLLSLFVVPLVFQPVLDISGKSVGEYLVFYLLGYFVLSKESVLQTLDKHRFLLTGLFAVGVVWLSLGFITKLDMHGILYEAIVELYAWVGVLTLLGMSRHYLNFSNKATLYCSKASFSVYIFHLPWIVVIAFYATRFTPNPIVQIVLILAVSIPLTFLSHEVCGRIGLTRFMFGLKHPTVQMEAID